MSGFSSLGGNNERGVPLRPRAGAPVVHIRIYSLLGGDNIWRLPPEAMTLPRKHVAPAWKAWSTGALNSFFAGQWV
jgi:hypothetical protein